MDYTKYYTPPQIATILVGELNVKTPHNVIDICCGSCNLLYAIKDRWENIELHGVDIINSMHKKVKYWQMDGREFALRHRNEYDLVVANPPFDFLIEKGMYPKLYEGDFEKINCSRLEIEMLLANLYLLKNRGTLMIIMPSSFVEAKSYKKFRTVIAKNYYVSNIIRLPDNVFGFNKIKSYGLIIKKSSNQNKHTKLGQLMEYNPQKLVYYSNIDQDDMKRGDWLGYTDEVLNTLDIKRGNISSQFFTEFGRSILHTAKESEIWKPSKRYIDYNSNAKIFAEKGDIIFSRIGKSAGQWCRYNGKKIPISDCLFRIKDPEGKIYKIIYNHKYNFPVKGVTTRYVTIDDIVRWIDNLDEKNN